MQSRSLLGRNFNFFMPLLIAAVVFFGLSFTVNRNLLHPAIPSHLLLYSARFGSWPDHRRVHRYASAVLLDERGANHRVVMRIIKDESPIRQGL
jgi:hypothetical protein